MKVNLNVTEVNIHVTEVNVYLARVLSSPLQTGADHGVSDVTVVGVIAVVIRHNGDADLGSHGYNHAGRELNIRRRKKETYKKNK